MGLWRRHFSNAYEPAHVYNASGVFTVVLTAYTRSGNVDKSYLDIEINSPTMLEVEVLEYYDQYPVSGASVILYPTETDWDNETNAIVEGSPTPPERSYSPTCSPGSTLSMSGIQPTTTTP